MFEKIKTWYKMRLWNKMMVYNAVAKNVITPDEYELITGEAYAE